jgi:hypothetical protein
MPQAKAVKATAKKAPLARKKKAPARKAATKAPSPRTRAPRKPRAPVKKTVEVIAPPVEPEALPQDPPTAIEDAQSQVVASKFANADAPAAKAATRPNLPTSYGESHLLLLVRDPQTLFAAWDIAPSTTDALKSRLGRRGFAVSTLTLRLTRAGGPTTVVHAGKKARSRYLKIEGGPSFVAEIGFTTPAGQFEFVARSAPCFVPMGPVARHESAEAERRAVGYREAAALARRGGLGPDPRSSGTRSSSSGDGSASSAAASSGRVLGGASDLYRR